MATKYKVNQIVQAPTTNQNNTKNASVVIAGTSGSGQNVYLVKTEDAQSLVIESQLLSHI